MFTEIAVAAGLPSGRELSLSAPVRDPGAALLLSLWCRRRPHVRRGFGRCPPRSLGGKAAVMLSRGTFLLGRRKGEKGGRLGVITSGKKHESEKGLTPASRVGSGAHPGAGAGGCSGAGGMRVRDGCHRLPKAPMRRERKRREESVFLQPAIPPPPKPGWRHCPRAGITAPGYAEAVLGEKCHGRKGGRAGGVLCGHNNENIIPDSRDVMGTFQTPQRTTGRGGKKGRQKNKGK